MKEKKILEQIYTSLLIQIYIYIYIYMYIYILYIYTHTYIYSVHFYINYILWNKYINIYIPNKKVFVAGMKQKRGKTVVSKHGNIIQLIFLFIL